MVNSDVDVKVARQRWEYSVKNSLDDPAKIEAEFNQLGDQCWELVSFAAVGHGFQAVFKRPTSLFTVRVFKEEDYEEITFPNSPR